MLFDKINLENAGNKLLYLFSQKSRIFKCCLLALFMALLLCLWLFLGAKPLNAKLVAGRVKLKQLNAIKTICSQSYDQCADLSQKIDHLTLKINKKLDIIGNSSAYLGLGKVIECINGNGVTLIDYSPGKVEKLSSAVADKDFSQKQQQFGKKVTFELTLEASYLNILNFFKCLSTVKYCLKYNQISIIKNEQGLIGCKLHLDILQISK